MRTLFKFFLRHAGYRVGYRAQGALQLARAYDALQDDIAEREAEIIWGADSDADLSFVETWSQREQDAFWAAEHYAEYCELRRGGVVIASLYGIIDADNNYRQVIEAELACEAGYGVIEYAI